jgi:hypothetical protein
VSVRILSVSSDSWIAAIGDFNSWVTLSTKFAWRLLSAISLSVSTSQNDIPTRINVKRTTPRVSTVQLVPRATTTIQQTISDTLSAIKLALSVMGKRMELRLRNDPTMETNSSDEHSLVNHKHYDNGKDIIAANRTDFDGI